MKRHAGSLTQNILGQRFGRLTVIKWSGTDAQRGSMWLCRCDCGTERVYRRRNLITPGNTLSCGCHRVDVQRARRTKHGESDVRSKEYVCWNNMVQRCYNPKNPRYKSYGAKGVIVCNEWRYDFTAFLRDVGRAPFATACIDRIDPFGNYEPRNIRWLDADASNHNRR